MYWHICKHEHYAQTYFNRIWDARFPTYVLKNYAFIIFFIYLPKIETYKITYFLPFNFRGLVQVAGESEIKNHSQFVNLILI